MGQFDLGGSFWHLKVKALGSIFTLLLLRFLENQEALFTPSDRSYVCYNSWACSLPLQEI